MSQPRQKWDETRKPDILRKLQMFKGDAIELPSFIDASGIN